jgi:hypothetical protein
VVGRLDAGQSNGAAEPAGEHRHLRTRLLSGQPLLTPLDPRHGLSDAALVTYEKAQARTAWALRHRRRFALVASGTVLATAERYDLTARLDGQPVTICAIAAVPTRDADGDGLDSVVALEAQLLGQATRSGVDMALLFRTSSSSPPPGDGFEVLPISEVELAVTESARHGAPMVPMRGGEQRDLDAIAAMGRIRASQYRFHLDRDVDHVQHAITRMRLRAGLAPPGMRRLEFVIAEEGITAAAYLVMSIVDGRWTIEECGDRDVTGARVGALLQALIAREPAESRPVIRAWLPPGFLPPQITIAATPTARASLLARPLSPRIQGLRWSAPDVLYWLADVY